MTLTRKGFEQLAIRQEDWGLFALEERSEREQLFPRSIEYHVEPCEDWNRIRFVVRGVSVSVTVEVSRIEILVEGEMPEELASRIAEEVRAKAEAASQRSCVLQRL
jgi:hypothetical protein